MNQRQRNFRFEGESAPSVIQGTRVVERVPLTPILDAAHRTITVSEFLKRIEHQLLEIVTKNGLSTEDFGLYLDKGLPIAISFTRPMTPSEHQQVHSSEPRSERTEEPTKPAEHEDPAPAEVSEVVPATPNEPLPDFYANLVPGPSK